MGGNFVDFGLQLYSVRDYMAKNVLATLKRAKEVGYDYVEVAGLFGLSGKEFKKLLDECNLTCVSAHQGYNELLNDSNGKLLQDYLDLGVKYIVIPWMPKETFDSAKTFHDMLGKIQELHKLLSPYGIKLGYHNHEYEFEYLDSKLIFDEIYNILGRDKLMPELDICWADYAGFSANDILMRYNGCIEIMHLKNYICTTKTDGQFYELIGKKSENKDNESDFRFQTLNVGKINMSKVINCAKEQGVKYAFVEMDDCYGQDSLECAAVSADFLKKLTLKGGC